MRDEHGRQAPRRGVLASARHDALGGGGVPPDLVVGLQAAHDLGIDERAGVDEALLGDGDRLGRAAHVAAQVHAAGGEQARAEGEPLRRVVVPRHRDDRHAQPGEPGQDVVEERDGLRRRHRAVVQVARPPAAAPRGRTGRPPR